MTRRRDALEARTRRYAKRQRTWMRRLPGVQVVDAARDPRAVAADIAGLGMSRPAEHDAVREARDALVIVAAVAPVAIAVAALLAVAAGDFEAWMRWLVAPLLVAGLLLGTLGSALLLADRLGRRFLKARPYTIGRFRLIAVALGVAILLVAGLPDHLADRDRVRDRLRAPGRRHPAGRGARHVGPVDILPPMKFGKWHGAGNAYLVIEAADAPLEMTPARVARICHADLGAGSDGILVIDGTAVRILNPDGSDAEFSGNGSRIAARHIAARDGLRELELVTPRGAIAATVDGQAVTIDVGQATLDGPDHRPNGGPPPAPAYTFVNLGNPHCVIEEAGVDDLDLRAVGAPIEHHRWFPNRANVEFYRPVAEGEIRMRVWERGAGETLSSGSGSSAAAVAAVVAGRARSPVTVHTDGGDLVVEVSDDLDVRLSGPVEHVCDGVFSAEFVAGLERL